MQSGCTGTGQCVFNLVHQREMRGYVVKLLMLLMWAGFVLVKRW